MSQTKIFYRIGYEVGFIVGAVCGLLTYIMFPFPNKY